MINSRAIPLARESERIQTAQSRGWRRRRDSNPRDPFGSNGFQDRRFQPLTHSSVFNSNVFCELAANLLHWRLELLHFGAGCSKIVAAPASFPTATTFEA